MAVDKLSGGREFTPAHVVGSTAVFIPEAFDVTFEFTLPGEPTLSEMDTSSKPNVHGDMVTCSFDVTQTFPEGGPSTYSERPPASSRRVLAILG